jgi:hypothetical protein
LPILSPYAGNGSWASMVRRWTSLFQFSPSRYSWEFVVGLDGSRNTHRSLSPYLTSTD